jgi:ketosteroid isomerase-like protein
VPEASAARDIVARLITDTDDARANHITDDDRLLVIGVDSGTELRGAAARERDTVRALFGYDFQVKGRDLRVKTSATGQIAWAAANVVVDDGGSGADRRELPLRVTYVLEKAAGEWRVVQMHVSAGVTSQELSLRVFGETVL